MAASVLRRGSLPTPAAPGLGLSGSHVFLNNVGVIETLRDLGSRNEWTDVRNEARCAPRSVAQVLILYLSRRLPRSHSVSFLVTGSAIRILGLASEARCKALPRARSRCLLLPNPLTCQAWEELFDAVAPRCRQESPGSSVRSCARVTVTCRTRPWVLADGRGRA